MGTNYYAIPKASIDSESDIIDSIDDIGINIKKLHTVITPIHVGKSSVGWKFIFNHNDWQYYNKNRASIKTFLSNCKIVNEYGATMLHDEFWLFVNSKHTGLDNKEYYLNWNKYHTEPKPSYITDDNYGEMYHDDLRFSISTDFC